MRALLVAALLLVPLASAGDASSPEITDATGDATFAATGANACPGGDCQGPAAVADIIQGWIVETETMLTFVVQIVSAEANKVYGPQEHQVFFSYVGTEYAAGIRLGTSSTAGGDDAVDPMGIATAARIGSDQYEWDVPRDALGGPVAGDVLEGMYMTSLQQGASAGDTQDRAPDSDGVTYTFTLGGTGEPSIVYRNHTGGNVNLTATYTEPTERVEVNNWTFDGGDIDIRLDFNGTGAIALRIDDGAGATALNSSFEAGTHEGSIRNATGGDWTIQVSLQDVNGTYRLDIQPFVPDTGGSETSTMTQPTTTEDPGGNTTGGEDTPFHFGPVILALLAAFALRRR